MVFDGAGLEVDASLVSTPDGWLARPDGPPRPGRAGVGVHLWYGLPKGDKLETVLRQATELGVERVRLLACQRSVVRLEGGRKDGKLDRLARVAAEAARQCGRADVPTVEAPATVAEALAAEVPGLLLVLHPEGGRPLVEVPLTAPVTVCVGPEGGFSPDELARFDAAGGIRVTLLGPVLRTETAAPVACALVLHGLGAL
ncbi:MAG: RsmE family RNA methyltransferase [bacterium]